MSAPADFHFYEDIFSNLNDALNLYIVDVSERVIDAIDGVAWSMLMIYVMLWGWTTMRGMISEPVTDAMARIIRLTLIVTLAINLGYYQMYIQDFLWDTPEALAAVVVDGSTEDGNVQFLDEVMSTIYDVGDAYWQKANAAGGWIPDFGLMAIAILIWAAGAAATAYGAFLLALAKMALAILLGLGPLFVLLLIFEGTKRFFESWLGQALNYVFLVVLTAGALKLIVALITEYLTATTKAGIVADPTIDRALPVVVMCVIAALVMTQLPSIASALGGGAAISTMGAANMVYQKAKGAVGGLRPTAMRRAYVGARNDMRIAGRVAGKVGGVPMAVYRRITGGNRSSVKQLGSN